MKNESARHTTFPFRQTEIRANTTSVPSPRRGAPPYLKRLTFTFALALSLASIAPAWAQNALTGDPPAPPADLFSRKYLLGDWGGERTALTEKGIVFDFFYTSDLEANPSGGLEQTKVGWPRGTIDINFDRIISWQGLSFHATVSRCGRCMHRIRLDRMISVDPTTPIDHAMHRVVSCAAQPLTCACSR